MRAVVIGGGIAGLSTAVGLAREGVEVDVIEADAPQERTGAGISLLGDALRALGELDLADPCLDAGFGFDEIDIVDGDGNVMMSDRAPTHFPVRPAGVVRNHRAQCCTPYSPKARNAPVPRCTTSARLRS